MNKEKLLELLQMQEIQKNSEQPVFTIKAGKCTQKKTDKKNEVIVQPIDKKGELIFFQKDFLEVKWRERAPNSKFEMEFVVLPDSVNFFKVNNVEGGRVYCLDFYNQHRQEFFWLQDSKEKNDEKKVKKINSLLKGKTKIQENQTELLKNLTGQKKEKPKENTLSEDFLKQVISSIQPANSSGSSSSQNTDLFKELAEKQKEEEKKAITLSEVLKTEKICNEIDKDPKMTENLLEYLPEEEIKTNDFNTKKNILKENIRSPQFQGAIRTMDYAIQSGQILSNMESFGFDPLKTGGKFGAEGFLNSVEGSVKKEEKKQEKKEEEKKEKDKKEEDDKMDID